MHYLIHVGPSLADDDRLRESDVPVLLTELCDYAYK